jgi:segregation and condensation protein A
MMEPPEFESILEAYPVRLANFEGPLDLLLHLIKKSEVSIYDIPITLVTKQYLEYIDLMQELNLDVAGEFLVMAATLIHIKSRMLLPRADPTQEDPQEDPREALMRRLLEHQKFKAAAELLHERETLRSAQWTRPDGPLAEIAGEAPEPEIDVDLFSLISAFRAVVERARQRPKVYLPSEQISIEDRIEQLMAKLSETEACGFEDLFAEVQTRAGLIVTFLAMLEMIRLKLIRVFQSGVLGPIRVYKRARPADAPKPILDPEKRHSDAIALQASAAEERDKTSEIPQAGDHQREAVENAMLTKTQH